MGGAMERGNGYDLGGDLGSLVGFEGGSVGSG